MNKIDMLIIRLEEADEVDLMEFDFDECFGYLRDYKKLLAWREKAFDAHPNIDIDIENLDT
tara:strand:- start:2609 stop:2791 length:183 start_codon:yes stop_codon:yes gene_type:complete